MEEIMMSKTLKKIMPEDIESNKEAQEKLKQALPKIFKWNDEQDGFDYLVSLDEFDLVMAKATGVGNRNLQAVLHGQIGGVVQARGKDLATVGNEILALLYEINPKTPLEGMLAVQMVGMHYLTTEMMNRAAHPDQSIDGVDRNVNRVTKLSRLFVAQIEVLQKLQGKGQQTVRVEHVTVNAGGQAIVGNVDHQGGGGKNEK
jgi:hypothetical protein